MTMKVTRTAVRWGRCLVALAAAVAAARGAAEGAQMCLSMANSGGAVAGMQVDISWDGSCVEATAGRGTSAGCTANPANGKQANSRLMGSTMRVLLFATDNVDPIPDGELFCCAFKEPANPCCSLQLSKLIASDPGGQRLTDPNLTFVATMDGNACAQLGVGGASSSGTSPARGNLGRQQQAPVGIDSANSGAAGAPVPQQPAPQQQPAQAAPQQQAQAAPQAGPAGGPIGVPPPTSPREMAQVPPAEVPQARPAAPGAVEAPAAAGAQGAGQAQLLAAATATAAASPQAAAATPVAVAPTSTKVLPTATKTIPAPTATPTAKGGFLSGCNMR